MKEEALALADYLDNNVEAMLFTEQPHLDKASSMIRRLVEELDKPHKYDPETGEPLIDGYPLFSGLPRGKPLSDEEIDKLADEYLSDYFNMQETIIFVRAIEERHGIK